MMQMHARQKVKVQDMSSEEKGKFENVGYTKSIQ